MALTRPELELLYQELETPLLNYALRWVWNPGVAEDLVHDAFVRLWRRRDSVEPATLKGLVYKTVHNLCLNELRKRRLREAIPFLDLFASSGDLHDDFVRRNDLARLREALEGLPVDLREVLLLTEFSDLGYEEVARILEIPAGTVGSRKSRAIALLRERLQGGRNV